MNYYDVLRVSQNATLIEIKKAYKALVKRYHPDIYEGNKLYAENKIKEINEAYEILSEENTKKEYDSMLDNGYYNVSKLTMDSEKTKNKGRVYKNINSIDKTEEKIVYNINIKTFLYQIDSKLKKEQKENIIICGLIGMIIISLSGIIRCFM